MNKEWNCHVRTRFMSCGWDFTSYEEAMGYAKDQWNHVCKEIKRFPSYQGQDSDYRATVVGPDGTNHTIFFGYFK